MTSLDRLVVLMLALVVALAIALLLLALRRHTNRRVYVARASLCSPKESALLEVLDRAVGSDYRVFAKVRLADVATISRDARRKARQQAFDRIRGKHLDFLLCRPQTLEMVCAIELDDQSFDNKARKARNTFVAELCRAIELPLIRVPAQNTYTVPRIRELIDRRLAAAAVAGVDTNAEPWLEDPGHGNALLPAQGSQTRRPSAPDAEPKCPKCGSTMVRRTVKTGGQAGRSFLNCSRYPSCRGVVTELKSASERRY